MSTHFSEDRLHYPCGNCCENQGTTVKIKDFGNSTDEIGIIDAVAYVYGVPVGNLLPILKNWSSKRIEEYSEEQGTEKILLCESCTLILSQIYTAHKQFENVSHSSSFVPELNAFRLRCSEEPHQSLGEEVVENCASPLDYECRDDDLVESFNFEEKCEADDQQLEGIDIVENKWEVGEVEELQPNSQSISISEKGTPDSKPEPRVTRSCFKLRQLVVKLERLPTLEVENIKGVIKSPRGKKRGKFVTKYNMNQKSKSKPILMNQKVVKTKVTRNYNSSLLRKGKYQCKVCGLRFADSTYYKSKHLPLHYGKDISKKCDICGKILTRAKFQRHMDIFHGDEQQKQKWRIHCKICGKEYSDVGLRNHMKLQHSGARESYKCAICAKEYISKSCYDEHILTHSENFTPYLCGQCGKTFGSKVSLMSHQYTHTEEKRFSCDICSKKFSAKADLKIHQHSHSTERKFMCDECGQTFKLRKHLRTHLKLHAELAEKGEKNAKCEECGKMFKHSLSLYKHKTRVHRTDLKKTVHECSFCGKRLTSGWNLRFHEKTVHKNHFRNESDREINDQ